MRGLTRSILFEAGDGCLISRGYELCWFVPMRGAGQNRERLREVFGQPPADAWSGLIVPRMTPFDNLDLRLATILPGYALLDATQQARDRGLVTARSGIGISTLINGGSFAYVHYRAVNPERTLYEFGACGHGPDGAETAAWLADQIAAWGIRREDRATFRACPAGTPRTPPSLERPPANRPWRTADQVSSG